MAFTEREFLEKRQEQIHEERRKLNEEYWAIANRLRELDGEERETLQSVDLDSTLSNLIKVVDKFSSLMPNVPAETIINGLLEKQAELGVDILVDENDSNNIEESQILELKDSEKKKDFTLNRKSKDLKIVRDKIISYIKERGIPVKSKEIEKYLKDEFGWTWKNFTVTMTNVMNIDSRVERASKGYYQVK